jgi:hypothetical protein
MSTAYLVGCGARAVSATDAGDHFTPLDGLSDVVAEPASPSAVGLDGSDGAASFENRPCNPTDARGSYLPGPGLELDQSMACWGEDAVYVPTVLGWAWDGRQCMAIVGCDCRGADCGTLLPRRSACDTAYAHCAMDGG